jgi:hypothetical protein
MKNNNMIITIGICVVVAALAFYGGMQYQKTQTRNTFFGMNGQGSMGMRGQGGGFRGGNRNGMAPVVGQVVSQDATSLTVKLQDGSSKIVNISASTTISKTDTGSKSDLKNGENIAAFGTANSDGSITAQNIQLNPILRLPGNTSPTPTK